MTAGLALRLAPVALAAGLLGVAAPASAGESADVDKALAAVKASHDKYQDPKVAIADGFLPTDSCVTHENMGTMGFHYVNPKLIGAPIDQAHPAILVYQPDGNGGRELVAVEWFQPDADQDLSTSEDKPSLFGRAFDGPMEGHEPGMPRHYDEHAWLWLDNPKGTLEPYNPAASCKGAETIVTVPAAAMPAHEGMDSDVASDAASRRAGHPQAHRRCRRRRRRNGQQLDRAGRAGRGRGGRGRPHDRRGGTGPAPPEPACLTYRQRISSSSFIRSENASTQVQPATISRSSPRRRVMPPWAR